MPSRHDIINHILRLPVVVFDRRRRFIFLGNRKAALHSVCRYHLAGRAVMFRDDPGKWQQLRKTELPAIERRFIFTIIRNPYARMVSAFFALQQYSGRFAGLTFARFVKTRFADQGPGIDKHFAPQHPNVFLDGRVFVDFVARMERIGRMWRHIAEAIDCGTMLPHKNRSAHGHYSTYYDDDCVDIVSEAYRRDIKSFNYEFERA